MKPEECNPGPVQASVPVRKSGQDSQFNPVRPPIDPEPLPVRVLQFGEGNFLRAFVDWILQRMNERIGFQAGVAVVQPIPTGTVELLNRQNGIYTVLLEGLEQGKPVRQLESVSCIQRALDPFKDPEALLREGENPDLQFLVSNTTEAGIVFQSTDRWHDFPNVSFPAKLTRVLQRRFDRFGNEPGRGLTLLPCELIDRNADTLRDIVLKYARHWGLSKDFTDWIQTQNRFCNTLVDRIVPGFPESKAGTIWAEIGWQDPLLVGGESFHLWAIEGDSHLRKTFPAEQAGLNVRIVDDLEMYRTRKVRLLNGTHTAMAALGLLSGQKSVRETLEHPRIGPFIRDLMFQELLPSLPSGADNRAYAESVIERFLNPFLEHRLESIALNSAAKFRSRLFPVLEEALRNNTPIPKRIVFSLAALLWLYQPDIRSRIAGHQDEPKTLAAMDHLWRTTQTSAEGFGPLVNSLLECLLPGMESRPSLPQTVRTRIAELFHRFQHATPLDVLPLES